eukprot:gene22221-28771_t
MFENFSLKAVLKDYSERYQVAKNAFERALTEAVISNNLDLILDSFHIPVIREEVQQLLAKIQAQVQANANNGEDNIILSDIASVAHPA